MPGGHASLSAIAVPSNSKESSATTLASRPSPGQPDALSCAWSEKSISVALRVGTPQNCHPLSTFPDDATAAAAAAAAAAAVNTDACSATFGSAIALHPGGVQAIITVTELYHCPGRVMYCQIVISAQVFESFHQPP